MNSEILKLLTETSKYLGKKRKSNLEVLVRNLSLETSQNLVSGLTWYETNLLGRSFHVVQNLYYRCNEEDNTTNDQPYRAEAQKPGWQGGIAIRKFFARPEIFCA